MPEAPRGVGSKRAPGLREVVLVAVLAVAAVFGVEIVSTWLPPLREAFRALPITIVALVVATTVLLVAIAVRRPRP